MIWGWIRRIGRRAGGRRSPVTPFEEWWHEGEPITDIGSLEVGNVYHLRSDLAIYQGRVHGRHAFEAARARGDRGHVLYSDERVLGGTYEIGGRRFDHVGVRRLPVDQDAARGIFEQRQAERSDPSFSAQWYVSSVDVVVRRIDAATFSRVLGGAVEVELDRDVGHLAIEHAAPAASSDEVRLLLIGYRSDATPTSRVASMSRALFDSLEDVDVPGELLV